MKKIITIIFLTTSFVTHSQVEKPKEKNEMRENPEWTLNPKWNYYQDIKNFHFIKQNSLKLESCDDGIKNYLEKYTNSNYDKLISKTKEEQNKYFESVKKFYLGATILKTPNDTIGEYIKLSDIPDTENFALIAFTTIEPRVHLVKSERREKPNPFDSTKPQIYYVDTQSIPYFYGDDGYYNAGKKTKVLIQNLKTKLYYVVNQDAIEFSYGNCEKLSFNAPSQIFKIIPKEMTQAEKDFLAKYKSLIKTAKSKTEILGTIQRKYLTRGYFDSNKVNGIDKKTYNNTLIELKKIAKELKQFDNEDKNNIAQDKLSMDELATLSNVNNWNLNYYPID